MADANSRRSQRQRKAVHYDESDEGEEGPPSPQKAHTDDSEDDFAESPLERRKNNKAKSKDKEQKQQRHEHRQTHEGRRVAVHDRQFEKDLQKALELSKKQAVQVISLDSDEDTPPPARPAKKADKKSPKQTARPRAEISFTQDTVDTSSQEASQDVPLSGVAPIPPSPEDTVPATTREPQAQPDRTIVKVACPAPSVAPQAKPDPAPTLPAATPVPPQKVAVAQKKAKPKPTQPTNENNVLHERPATSAMAKPQMPTCGQIEQTPGGGTRPGSTYCVGAVRRVGLSRHHRAKPLHPYLKQ